MPVRGEQWNPEQRQAIETVDRSVLVGAAAGSGKTAVLARRCAYLVSDAPPEFRCDVDDLLVVTFTEAAASEMRVRIGRAIRDRLDERPGDVRLRYQLAALDGAAISTIHSFCRRVLKQWFAAADLDPDFDLLDEDEQMLLQRDAVEQVFAELYEDAGPSGQRFRHFVDLYGDGRDRVIADRVIWLAEYLNSIVDPQTWLTEARRWLVVPDTSELPPLLGQTVARRLRQELGWQHRDCARAAEAARSRHSAAAYIADILEGHAEQLSQWAASAGSPRASELDRLTRQIREYEFPAKRGGPRLPQEGADEERAARAMAGQWHDRVKKAFVDRLRDRWCRFDVKEMAEGLKRVRPLVETLCELVDRFTRRYRELKEQDRRLDFADLERKTLDLLSADESDNEVVRSLRKRFRYVCVDEFQDVNPVQEAILRQVSGEPDSDRPDNLFCVGDVKQSIYRFRLAEPGIFAARQERFRRAEGAGLFIPLGWNYRSREGLIDGVNAIFERLMTQEMGPIMYDRDARLHPGLAYPAEGGMGACVELHLLERKVAEAAEEKEPTGQEGRVGAAEWEVIEREAYCVGRRIRQLMGMENGFERACVCVKPEEPGGEMKTEPLDFRHIVILLRSRQYKAEPIANVLSRMDIPVHAELSSGYFESTEVRDVLALLSLLDNRQQDIPLAAAMRSPLLAPHFDESDLVRVRSVDAAVPFHEAVSLYARKGEYASLAERCALLGRLLDRFSSLVRRRPLADGLWQIYAETGCLAYVAGLPGGRQRRANLIKLHERARQFGTFARQGLYRFLRFMQQLEEAGRDLGAALPASESDNVVRIMSIHASKGLEFPIVILPDLAKAFNFEDTRGRIVVSRDYYIGPKVVDDELDIEFPTVAHALAVEDGETQTRTEEMRVLYVAMTRAREKLIIVGTALLTATPADALGAEWAGYRGAPPALTLSAANSYLDWLLPALGCQRASASDPWPPWLSVSTHSAEEIHGWAFSEELVAREREERSGFADMKPLSPDEPVAGDEPLVDETLRRLRQAYAYDDLTAVPSVLAVTELKRRYEATRQLDDQSRELALAWPGTFAGSGRGRAMRGEGAARAEEVRDLAAERGTATHLLLQHVDLAAVSGPDLLDVEVEKLIGRGLLSHTQVELIDRQAVLWFFQTPLGRELRQAGKQLRREVMFVSRIPPEMFDPAVRRLDERDAILVRGVIDVLLVDADGCRVIDYKTDRIGTDEVPARAEQYRPQLDLYARAAHELTGLPVTQRVLVFLEPRQVCELGPSGVP
ncbi:MAG: helicase-exonuclease AddAB subunit AddA [Phycisphaerales bacterium]|nr:MAG: helicase-exonuclease AddAB subunit AddA [Phycisphaerales bacterium]